MRLAGILALLAAAVFTTACAAQEPAAALSEEPEILAYEIVAVYPHNDDAFTQGLFFRDGALYETTGQYGASTLRRVALESGETEQIAHLPDGVFGEGSTSWGDEIVTLTWKRGIAFRFDPETFKQKGRFSFRGEGWGLTHDGKRLIMSDGSSQLRFLDPQTFAETGRIDVAFRGKPLDKLNELEWIDGAIYANVWQADAIVRIDPESGAVTALADMRGLLSDDEITPGKTDVLNGIAYDPQTERLFVTGKYWPKLFEIKLKKRDN